MTTKLSHAADQKPQRILCGHGVSDGMAIGTAFLYQDCLLLESEIQKIHAGQVDDEYNRIHTAIEWVVGDLNETACRVGDEIGQRNAEIFTAQAQMLTDSTLHQRFYDKLKTEQINAEQVVKQVLRQQANLFRAMEDDSFQHIEDDIVDLTRRLIRRLFGIHAHVLEKTPENSILVASRLLPSDTVHLSRHSALGIITEFGGVASHTALLARGMGIPAITGIKNVPGDIDANDVLIADGNSGQLIVNPTVDTLKDYARAIARQRSQLGRIQSKFPGSVTTADGAELLVMANVGSREDTERAIKNGADGIGLFRTGEIYLALQTLPTEEFLYKTLRHALTPAGNRPCTIRLPDIGSDKHLPFLNFTQEVDPALGLRGIRLLKKYPNMLEAQLRVYLRLSKEMDVRILVPMVTDSGEMKWVRDQLSRVAAEIEIPAPPLGAMVETPAAVLCIEEILTWCDFINIGTNDLTQYTLAAGRENLTVEAYYNDSHPAVLRLLKMIIEAKPQIPVGICGELSSNTEMLPQLIAMGYRIFSVAPPQIAKVKNAINNLPTGQRVFEQA